jgi:zinc transport system ATP-binding protein
VSAADPFPLLSCDGLTVTRKGRRILDNVSLAVMPGEFVTVIGPNGAGKSLLLGALIGLTRPDGGTVTRRPGLKIGYMPQRFSPEPALPMSVRRFLSLAKGVTPARIDEALALTGTAPYAGRQLHVLSGGELQRVLLARALLHDPDILVLDEPAQNLDIGGELSFYRLLDTIYRERGCAVLMVSHDLHMVMASTGRVICLFHHVCCSGAPSAVAKAPEFTALFGQDMTKMMAVYHHDHGHGHSHEHDHEH